MEEGRRGGSALDGSHIDSAAIGTGWADSRTWQYIAREKYLTIRSTSGRNLWGSLIDVDNFDANSLSHRWACTRVKNPIEGSRASESINPGLSNLGSSIQGLATPPSYALDPLTSPRNRIESLSMNPGLLSLSSFDSGA
ncbi:hypothetical protein CRG98_033121 [Punica granatum]|uniref:Uncharacterized protein n=1 Tax=Punica granatum TaxID=22663 RepID=A0A2I0IR64_PUNGR|nr:hypothetical protein CRG98_033121 [Punica granatum]